MSKSESIYRWSSSYEITGKRRNLKSNQNHPQRYNTLKMSRISCLRLRTVTLWSRNQQAHATLLLCRAVAIPLARLKRRGVSRRSRSGAYVYILLRNYSPFLNDLFIQLEQRIAKLAHKTHKDRVAEFNNHLESLSEHHDIPKVISKFNVYTLFFITILGWTRIIFMPPRRFLLAARLSILWTRRVCWISVQK